VKSIKENFIYFFVIVGLVKKESCPKSVLSPLKKTIF
jgi:hypothetical protein